jgi:nucleotide-binding universal stress UspA family protein
MATGTENSIGFPVAQHTYYCGETHMTHKNVNLQPLVRSVLHPTDFSSASDRAFANALAIALLGQTKLTLLHVHRNSDAIDWAQFPSVRKTLERWGLLEKGSAQGDVYEKLRVQVEKVELKGSFTALTITDFLESNPHDLIVLATEGEAGLPYWFSSSIAETIASATKTMALFVPQTAKRGLVSLENADYALRSILLPVDHAPDCTLAIELAKRAAAILGEPHVAITLLHVGDGAPPELPLENSTALTMKIEHQSGDVVTEIIAAANRLNADMIVMPTAGAKGFFEMFRGSTTQQVLRRAPCPVLAVPA